MGEGGAGEEERGGKEGEGDSWGLLKEGEGSREG